MTRAFVTWLLAGAFALVLTAPAGAAKPPAYPFDINSASMSEVVNFQGDGGPACQRAGVCGYSGTIRYSFDHADGLAIFLTRPRRVLGTADLFFNGLTAASVQAPDGGPPCTEEALQDFDGFEVEGTAARMRIVFHPAFDVTNYLENYCGGPSDLDIAHAHALPEIVVTPRTLRHEKVHLQVSSTRSFHSGPFVGTVTFSANIRMRRSRDLAGILNFLSGDL